MKTGTILWIAVAALAVIFAFRCVGMYNTMVGKQESVQAQAGNVDNQYQRRADLIPNLVNTVKGYASHEVQTLTEVTEARAKATQVTLDITDAKALEQYQKAQGEVSSALGRLMAISESYPDLKADRNFMALQDELAGTENRIAVERRKLNLEAQEYNTYIRRFPKNLIASFAGFEKIAYFETDEQARQAPKVEF